MDKIQELTRLEGNFLNRKIETDNNTNPVPDCWVKIVIGDDA